MSKNKKWFSVSDLRGLPGMPGSANGVRKRAEQNQYMSRKRRFGKGLEYALSSLPYETQTYLRAGVAAIRAPKAAPKATASVASPSGAAEPGVRAMPELELVQRLSDMAQKWANRAGVSAEPKDRVLLECASELVSALPVPQARPAKSRLELQQEWDRLNERFAEALGVKPVPNSHQE